MNQPASCFRAEALGKNGIGQLCLAKPLREYRLAQPMLPKMSSTCIGTRGCGEAVKKGYRVADGMRAREGSGERALHGICEISTRDFENSKMCSEHIRLFEFPLRSLEDVRNIFEISRRNFEKLKVCPTHIRLFEFPLRSLEDARNIFEHSKRELETSKMLFGPSSNTQNIALEFGRCSECLRTLEPGF